MGDDPEVDLVTKKLSGQSAEIEIWKEKSALAGETFSANVVTNAKSLGLMGAYMANKGTFNGK